MSIMETARKMSEQAAAQKGTPAPVEIGLRVVIIPAISAEEEARMSKRNYRRTVLDKSRIFGVRGITNAEFLNRSVTDQFLILRTFIPNGWRPAVIEPWFEAVKVDESMQFNPDTGETRGTAEGAGQ